MMCKEQKGITLVALVITIIVLLILAGVTIAALSGPNGILTNATQAGKDTAASEAKEAVTTAINTILTNKIANNTLAVIDDTTSLTISEIVTEINANYGADKASAATSSDGPGYANQIKYETGGYKVLVTLDTNHLKVSGDPVATKK